MPAIDVRHYVLAKSHSKAADTWNMQSLDGIMNSLQNSDNKRSLDIINEMISFTNNKLSQLFQHNNNSRRITPQQSLQLVQHDTKPYIVLVDRRTRVNLSDEPCSLELSERIAYDDAGYLIRSESGHWQPRYNSYEDDTKYYLIVELPGFKRGELNTVVSHKSMTIQGTRADFIKSLHDPTLHQLDIPVGSFCLDIPFKCEIERDEVVSDREEGFIRITIPKKRQEQINVEI